MKSCIINYYASWQECHEALVRQLYDDWHGWYQVVELVDGQYQPRRVLSRAEALAWINPDPRRFALDVKHVRLTRQ